jgi:ubiquinone/menaquinone biosynthesis C-methylase UbiE
VAKKDSGWWDDFFPTFRPVFVLISAGATNAQARYIIKKLGLREGKSFLDCPCGIGRIAIPLAKKGIRVTGVDITQSYLDELAAKAKRLKSKIEVVHGDMRRIKYDSRFDAAGNLWTSFGYFDKESENLLVLKKMFRALKPGGKFMLHVVNRDWIMANYDPHGWYEIPAPGGKGTIKIVEKRHFDYRTSINHAVWHFIKDGREKAFEMNLRMYTFHELIRMFEAAGFTDIEGYGSTKDEPICRERMMMFVIGTKPKRR